MGATVGAAAIAVVVAIATLAIVSIGGLDRSIVTSPLASSAAAAPPGQG